MSEDNKAVVRDVIEQGYNKNNLSVVEETYARDFVLHWLEHDQPVAEERGPEAAKAVISRLRKAFPDFHLAADTMIAEGDMVAAPWTITGTHRGEYVTALGTFPPTGNYVKLRGITIFRLSHGKIVEQRTSRDRLGFWQQMGGPGPSEILAKVARK